MANTPRPLRPAGPSRTGDAPSSPLSASVILVAAVTFAVVSGIPDTPRITITDEKSNSPLNPSHVFGAFGPFGPMESIPPACPYIFTLTDATFIPSWGHPAPPRGDPAPPRGDPGS